MSNVLQRSQGHVRTHYVWLCSPYSTLFSGPRERKVRPTRLRDISAKHADDSSAKASRFAAVRRPLLGQDSVVSGSQYVKREPETAAAAEVRSIFAAYGRVSNKADPIDIHLRKILQSLHAVFTEEDHKYEDVRALDLIDETLDFGEVLARDMMAGRMPLHWQTTNAVLWLFGRGRRTDALFQFWDWLKQQDDTAVSVESYASMLHYMAYAGTPLNELEDIYDQALARFPGNYTSYHFSPSAVVLDRAQPLNFKGLPIDLLRGIFTARILNAEIQKAYLTFDVALRLFPDQTPARFFTLLISERPVLEAYTVFAIACRAGIALSRSAYRDLVGKLRQSTNLKSPMKHVMTIRGQLSATYLYFSAGSNPGTISVNELVHSLSQVMQLRGVATLTTEARSHLVSTIMSLIWKVIEVFERYGVKPGAAAFNNIIHNIAGYGKAVQMIDIIRDKMKAADIAETPVTQRSILSAAGLLNNGDLLVRAWKDLVEARLAMNLAPGEKDFMVLIKAAHQSGKLDYARQQFEGMMEYIAIEKHHFILAQFEKGDEARDKHRPLNINDLNIQLDKIRQDLEIFDEAARRGSRVQDLENRNLPMTLLAPDRSLLPESEMRALYDELSTEPQTEMTATQGARSSSLPARSLTNIPFDELRYENWKTMNFLLQASAKEVQEYQQIVEECISQGRPLPERQLRFSYQDDISDTYGLSDVPMDRRTRSLSSALDEEAAPLPNSSDNAIVSEIEYSPDEIDQGRQTTLRLRA